MVQVNFKLYSIKRCGYYKKKSANPECLNIDTLFSSITSWAKNVHLEETCTFNPPDNSSILKSYLLNYKQSDTGDFYFCMWNEVPTSDQNAVAAVSGSSSLGKTDIQFKNFSKGYIPGFATYFWVSPKNKQLATVRFERSYNGHSSFKLFVKGFLTAFSQYVIKKVDQNDGSFEIIGYKTDNNDDPLNLIPRFETESLKKSGPIDFIRKNTAHILKVTKKALIIPDSEKEKNIYNYFYKLLGCEKDRKKLDENVYVYFNMPGDISLKDFDDIYSNWSESDDEEDIGFKIGSDTFWLSHEIQKTDMMLNIRRDNSEVYNLDSIMSVIEANKKGILNACSH